WWQGQLTGLVLFSVTSALLALRAGHEVQAGAWLILGLLKPQLLLGVGLVLLVTRHWRVLAVWAAGGAGLVGASFLAFGNWLPSYSAYLANYLDNPALGDQPALMQNWRGSVYMLLHTSPAPLVSGLTLLGLGLLVVLCWPGRPR